MFKLMILLLLFHFTVFCLFKLQIRKECIVLSKESEQQLILFFRHLTSFSGGNLKEITAKSRVRQLRKICIALEVELLDLIRESISKQSYWGDFAIVKCFQLYVNIYTCIFVQLSEFLSQTLEQSFSKVHAFVCALSLFSNFVSTNMSEKLRENGLKHELIAFSAQVNSWLKSDASAKKSYKADLRVSKPMFTAACSDIFCSKAQFVGVFFEGGVTVVVNSGDLIMFGNCLFGILDTCNFDLLQFGFYLLLPLRCLLCLASLLIAMYFEDNLRGTL